MAKLITNKKPPPNEKDLGKKEGGGKEKLFIYSLAFSIWEFSKKAPALGGCGLLYGSRGLWKHLDNFKNMLFI